MQHLLRGRMDLFGGKGQERKMRIASIESFVDDKGRLGASA